MGDIDFRISDGIDLTEESPLLLPDVPVTHPGDLWLLGEHRILCGDALDPGSFERVLDGRRASMVFTDPPYNVKIDGHVCGNGKIKHDEFAMASGEMSDDEFSSFLYLDHNRCSSCREQYQHLPFFLPNRI